MTIERACIQCRNCARRIVLPPQSHLGTFDGQISPSKDIWPINFLCLSCVQLSVIPPQAIHLTERETQGRNQLVRYDFSSALEGCSAHVAIYTQECAVPESLTDSREYVLEDEAEARVLLPSRLWRDSYGYPTNVGIDRGCEAKPPMWVFIRPAKID